MAIPSYVIASRLIFDGCLYTIWRDRAELHWARSQVLLSTTRLLIISVIVLALEQVGVPVITYIKVIAVVAFFGIGNAGFLAIAAYNVAIS